MASTAEVTSQSLAESHQANNSVQFQHIETFPRMAQGHTALRWVVPGASGSQWAHDAAFMPGTAGSSLGLWSRTLSGTSTDPKLVRGADDGGQGMSGCAGTTARAKLSNWLQGAQTRLSLWEQQECRSWWKMQAAVGMPRPMESREGMDTGAPCAVREVYVRDVISSTSYLFFWTPNLKCSSLVSPF